MLTVRKKTFQRFSIKLEKRIYLKTEYRTDSKLRPPH
jgi:hypothetical protein